MSDTHDIYKWTLCLPSTVRVTPSVDRAEAVSVVFLIASFSQSKVGPHAPATSKLEGYEVSNGAQELDRS